MRSSLITRPPSRLDSLSLHAAVPISREEPGGTGRMARSAPRRGTGQACTARPGPPGGTRLTCSSSRSASSHATREEEHTPELQSHSDLVCRLLLGKQNQRQDRSKL